MSSSLEHEVKKRTLDAGFDCVAITRADADSETGVRLDAFIEAGRHGTMEWIAATSQRRRHPQAMWPNARSAILVGLNYGPSCDPLGGLKAVSHGTISVYALNRDYHDIIKGRLKTLAQWLQGRTGEAVKVFVDTAPLMEKPLAERAGLGWQGKHTNLVSRTFGSWLFLGAILTSAELRPDEPEKDHCGNCRACLDICPTHAFPAPYQLDASRCISYLTIEFKGHIAPEFRPAIGNRIFGCDDCLAVCPWNKFAQHAEEAKLQARKELMQPELSHLAALDDATFRKMFAGSPVKRTGRDRFVRNVMIAIGNSGNARLLPSVIGRLKDGSPLVRAMAVWALSRLAGIDETRRHAVDAGQSETDNDVLAEWKAATT